ncbi:hypothetical protein D3C76_1646420 [compost metagenome]
MTTSSLNLDGDDVGGCHDGADRHCNGAQREGWPVVQCIDLFDGKPLEESIVNHFKSTVIAFLARLEDQIDSAVVVTRFL